MYNEEELQKGENAEDGEGSEGESPIGTITTEDGALACPIIHLADGVSACLGENCMMWVEEGDNLEAGCGFVFLSQFARLELARMIKYTEMAE